MRPKAHLRSLRQWTIVRLTWEDSQASAEWKKVKPSDRKVAGCTTVGMLEKVTRDAVVLVMSRDKTNKHAHGIMSIPLAAVLEVREL